MLLASTRLEHTEFWSENLNERPKSRREKNRVMITMWIGLIQWWVGVNTGLMKRGRFIDHLRKNNV
jgi:hypothetical protein